MGWNSRRLFFARMRVPARLDYKKLIGFPDIRVKDYYNEGNAEKLKEEKWHNY